MAKITKNLIFRSRHYGDFFGIDHLYKDYSDDAAFLPNAAQLKNSTGFAQPTVKSEIDVSSADTAVSRPDSLDKSDIPRNSKPGSSKPVNNNLVNKSLSNRHGRYADPQSVIEGLPPVTSESLKNLSSLEDLKSFCVDCRQCGLSSGRTNIVFGEGNPDADLMFLGEGPGKTEDEQARPFVGDAGKKLDQMIKAMGFEREDIYIANAVKCRPPGNRAPFSEEIDSCWPYIEKQIQLVSPKVIVTLGSVAYSALFKRNNVSIGKVRGKFEQYQEIQVMPTYHPAYIIRNSGTQLGLNIRRLVWSDLQQVMKLF